MTALRNHNLLTSRELGVITYRSSASNPVDNGLNNTALIAVVPPGSMVAGDLVLLYAQTRNEVANITSVAISDTGGQTWDSSIVAFGGTMLAPYVKIFWCTFNGTWASNPSVAFGVPSGSQIDSVVMHVFIPPKATNKWRFEGDNQGNFTDPAAPYEITLPGRTPSKYSNVSIAGWHTNGISTWASLTGANWNVLGSAQYRNNAGTDQTLTFAYQIQTMKTFTNNVTKTATTGGSGNYDGTYKIVTFYSTKF